MFVFDIIVYVFRWLGKSGPCGHEVEQENNWPMEQIFPFDGFPYGKEDMTICRANYVLADN